MYAGSLSSEDKIISQIAPKGLHELSEAWAGFWRMYLGNTVWEIHMSVVVAQSSQLFTKPVSFSFWTPYVIILDAVMWLSSAMCLLRAWPIISSLCESPWSLSFWSDPGNHMLRIVGPQDWRILNPRIITWRGTTCQVGIPVLDFKWASNKLLLY